MEGCNIVNSSYKYFFFLLNSGMEHWAKVLWVNVVWVLGVCFVLPAKMWAVSDNSCLSCNPSVVSPMELYPKIGVICLDEFNGDVYSACSIDIVPSVRVSLSLVFKVYIYFDVC